MPLPNDSPAPISLADCLHPLTWPIALALLLQYTLDDLHQAVQAPGLTVWYGPVRVYHLRQGTWAFCPDVGTLQYPYLAPPGTVEFYTDRKLCGVLWETGKVPRQFHPFKDSLGLIQQINRYVHVMGNA